jgi:hypothetical protein
MQAAIGRAIPLGIFFLGSLAAAQDPQVATKISPLAKTVLSLRDYAASNSVRGGLPELTLAKHQLRDWIESRLASFPEKGGVGALSSDLLAGLEGANLFCDDPSDCVATSIGFLDQVLVNRERGFLTIATAVGTGLRCGYDYSAYIYEWRGNQWHRIWEHEQNDYSAAAYHPQTLHAIHISDAAADGTRLILTLGTPAGCGGTFVPVRYQVWRLARGATGAASSPIAVSILDKSETLNDEGEPPAIGRVTPDDVLIEFSAAGTGYGLTHKALRHFEIHGATAAQTDPIAPTPRDFVEEWLAASWSDSAPRSDSPALREWHAKLHRDDGQGDFPDPALACANDPSLVEIATHFEGQPKHYFLVRTTQPLHFTMAAIGDSPFPNCTQPAPAADQQPSLLPANQ